MHSEQLKKNESDVIGYQNNLLQAMNQVAGLLLNTDTALFEKALHDSMQVIAQAANADCVYIWKNKIVDGQLCCFQLFEWAQRPTIYSVENTFYSYSETFTGWEELLSKGECVNALSRDLSEPTYNFLSPAGILSVLVVPIFLKGEFWGIVGFDNCRQERLFSKDEETILKSASILIANSFFRNEMTQLILDKSERLEEAVKQANEATLIKNNSLKALENILNSIDAAIYATVPDTGELLFVNTWIKRAFKIEGDSAIGKLCYKIFRRGMDDRCSFCPCIQLEKNPERTIVWEEYIPELDSHVRHSDCLIDWPDGSKVHLQHAVDITEIVKATEKANAANRSKSTFLSNMSHEMRTPMNAIVGMTAIGKRVTSLAEKDHALTRIEDASSHLLGVINDILDMAKIEADKLELVPVEYDFEQMLENVMSLIFFPLEQKHQKITVNVDKNIPARIIGDEQRLAQVLTNLLSNSVKFTPEGGTIGFNAIAERDEHGNCCLRVEVADSGIGISPEQQKRVFNAFEQVQSETSREYGGTGLGLPISKRIIELMGGQIWVESELGKGATFIFTVSLTPAKKHLLEEEKSESYSARARSGVCAHDDSRITFAGKNLLIAEDIEINREILLTLLGDSRLTIDCAENGKEAFDMITASPDKYDIVFMDLQMPQMSGLEATRQIRARERTRSAAEQTSSGTRLPIIAMTANVFKEDIDECLSAGMDGHLGKPLDIDKVMCTLRKHL
ncbi:MAG: response regulator [Treponema sp.]|jgi:signal transduction histidine kinase/ActR/RegA family two-component response regulator|nr:response regulator [Treponema sp.]